MSSSYLAVDIGASSGRHIIGTVTNGKISLEEMYRFENGVKRRNGHLCWDVPHLAKSVEEGIRRSVEAGFQPVTMGIDTWAVDFVLLDQDDQIIGDTIAYRDERTNGIREWLEESGIVSFDECYRRTGIQYQKFNTIYQLAELKRDHPEQLAAAKTFLMIPDYLNFLLTGVKANEYTNASTTGLVNAKTKDWDDELIEKIGLPRDIFQPIRMPGEELAPLKPELQARTGATQLKVILPATHDTGSAFLAVPARDDKAVFLSSGTWSLMGVENQEAITTQESEEANFTNEGGYEYRFRYLKNIMGLWMFQNVKKEIEAKDPSGQKKSFKELLDAAQSYPELKVVVDVDDDRFLAPSSMIREVRKACAEQGVDLPGADDRSADVRTQSGGDGCTAADAAAPDHSGRTKTEQADGRLSLAGGEGAVINVIFRSLAKDYARTVNTLKELTGKEYTAVNIVGGGSQNQYLNQLTANETGLTVFAGPTEGTALGNLIVQFIHAGEYPDLQAARDAIATSFDITRTEPG